MYGIIFIQQFIIPESLSSKGGGTAGLNSTWIHGA